MIADQSLLLSELQPPNNTQAIPIAVQADVLRAQPALLRSDDVIEVAFNFAKAGLLRLLVEGVVAIEPRPTVAG